MQDLEKPPGAPQANPEDKLKGEILASLADWRHSNALEGQDLAWHVMAALKNHIARHEGIEVWADFTQRLAKMSKEMISEIDHVLHEDAKTYKRFH